MISMILAFAAIAAASAQGSRAAGPTLHTSTADFVIDSSGALTGIIRKTAGDQAVRNYIAPGEPAPLLSIRVGGKLYAPDRVVWDASQRHLTLHYTPVGATAVVAAIAKTTHLVFELVKVESPHPIELALWGPYPTTIGQTIGETVGVVRDAEFAVGIQALNPKTLGGYPTHENDIEAESSGDDHGIYDDIPAELLKGQGYRGDTATPASFGSRLQAFCRDRSAARVIENWGHPKYDVLPHHDGGIIGSKIALFACPASKALATIGNIEIAEHLPHPMLDGVWGKISNTATCSYLIVDFSESNVDQAIAMAKRAGLKYLYHSSPFDTWGHFNLKKDLFPHGWDGLKGCIEKGKRAGIRIGFHTLSNFITPNDPYVTPVPDPRLAKIGSAELAADIDAAQTEIPVSSPEYFKDASALNTVVIGKELVRFGSLSKDAPWRLLECKRGAWGTQAATHARTASVARLLDHPYNVFHTDADLAIEVARNIAALCNKTGAQQLSFDGLEGNWSTGYGQYGRTLFTNAWYEALSPDLRGHVINDASNPGHFNWHIYTRMNWGEPWYAGFRESQTLYRFKNQVYFERNMMPRMLGWFALRPDTSIEDAEWLLARAAGFDAGFALATSLASTAQLTADPASAETAREYGATPAILEAIKQWETARKSGAFSHDVRTLLRDNNREFHLKPLAKGASPHGGWSLIEMSSTRYSHDAAHPDATICKFENHDAAQPLQWTLHVPVDKPLDSVKVSVDGADVIEAAGVSIPAGGNLKYSGGSEAIVTDANWKEIRRVPARRLSSAAGAHEIRIGSAVHAGVTLKIEIKTNGTPVTIPAR